MKNYPGKLEIIKWNRFDTDFENDWAIFPAALASQVLLYNVELAVFEQFHCCLKIRTKHVDITSNSYQAINNMILTIWLVLYWSIQLSWIVSAR